MGEAFAGRHVVVTGGGGALGQAVVGPLLEEGAHVHVPAFGDADVEALARFETDRLRVAENVDLGDADAVATFFGEVPLLWASVHIAGGFAWGAITDATEADFDRMMKRNAKSCWLCCKHAAHAMRDGGRVVNVTAKPALVPMPNLSAYAASKGAVAALTLSLAEELKERGIWVNGIAPSIIDTPANRAAMPDEDFDAWPKVDEVAATILFLVSPSNEATRGALVPVYGRS